MLLSLMLYGGVKICKTACYNLTYSCNCVHTGQSSAVSVVPRYTRGMHQIRPFRLSSKLVCPYRQCTWNYISRSLLKLCCAFFACIQNQVLLLSNSKCKRYFCNHLKPAKLILTAMHRKQQKNVHGNKPIPLNDILHILQHMFHNLNSISYQVI